MPGEDRLVSREVEARVYLPSDRLGMRGWQWLLLCAGALKMDTSLDHLDIHFRLRVFELLARIVEARIPIIIVNTFRTPADQADCVKRGVSWVTHSKHQDGLAIDVCPVETFLVHGGAEKLDWDPGDPVWQQLGTIGERLGLVWGGRWSRRDVSHFEQGS